jgi:ferric-dicitrate binding protein FerR (iron transport regulator)
MDRDEYIKKWLNDSLTVEERRQIEEGDGFAGLRKLSKALQYFKAPEFDTETELDGLHARMNAADGMVVSMHWIRPIWRVAAVLIVIMGIVLYLFNNRSITVQTMVSEHTEWRLPDNSEVHLNSGSVISYKGKTWGENRTLALEGEAYFEVQKGSQFEVETSLGIVRVLGTKFNVKERGSLFEVICYEGLVEVEYNGTVEKLNQNRTFTLFNGEIILGSLSEGMTSPDWLNGESTFRSMPFRFVKEEFERQYDVTISLENVDQDQLFTGRFTHSDIGLALEQITLPLNIKFHQTNDQKILLTGEQD